MKYVINSDWDGFSLPEEYLLKNKKNVMANWEDDDDIRKDPLLIQIVESKEYKGDLTIVEIPENATDYMVQEYDGWEILYYVLDGKIEQA